MSPESNRRDFLKGRSAARTLAHLAERALSGRTVDPWPAEHDDPTYLVRVSRTAMASGFEVILNAGQYRGGTAVALEVLDLLDQLEEQMSVFRATSEISRLNRRGAEEPVEVEPRLFALLELAVRLHAETEGAFDVTTGPLWRAWGFARRAGCVPGHDELSAALEHVGSHLVELDAARATVRFRQPGVELNLGSIGKGYALDRCAEALTDAGIDHFLLHGGQSSVLARGSRASLRAASAESPPAGWVVGIPNPTRHGTRLAEVRLRDRAIGTSGTRTQYFRYKGRRYGHILDPRTGMPAEGLLSATVVAPTGAEADALSTAFYVMGADKSREHCEARPELAAVLVCPAEGPEGLEIRSIGLKDDEFRVLDGSATGASRGLA
jgi:thiamine biosynthesis lipoprotein